MKNLHAAGINKFRVTKGPAVKLRGIGDETCGSFHVRLRKGWVNVIASDYRGWEHVSVSLPHRCPTWSEMEQVKRLFFQDDETCMQLHVAVTDHISVHPNCLHIWRPKAPVPEIPVPPREFI